MIVPPPIVVTTCVVRIACESALPPEPPAAICTPVVVALAVEMSCDESETGPVTVTS